MLVSISSGLHCISQGTLLGWVVYLERVDDLLNEASSKSSNHGTGNPTPARLALMPSLTSS